MALTAPAAQAADTLDSFQDPKLSSNTQVLASRTFETTSARAQAAVNYALAQRGKPYQWAAAGPYAFDCSGLTMRAAQAAGVNLPRTVAQQYAVTVPVAAGDERPGDLMIYGTYHVGIITHPGMVTEAPKPGMTIAERPISWWRGVVRRFLR
jgi:cell wall-associated NlpC family hydrolase